MKKGIFCLVAVGALLVSCATWKTVPQEFDSSFLSDKTVLVKKFENLARTSRAKGILSSLGPIAGHLRIEDFPKLEETVEKYQKIVFLNREIQNPTEKERFVLNTFRFPTRLNVRFVWEENKNYDYIIDGKINYALIYANLRLNPITGTAKVNITYYLKDRQRNVLFEKTITTEQTIYIDKEVSKNFLGQLLDATELLREMLNDLNAAILENVLKFYGCFVEYQRFSL